VYEGHFKIHFRKCGLPNFSSKIKPRQPVLITETNICYAPETAVCTTAAIVTKESCKIGYKGE